MSTTKKEPTSYPPLSSSLSENLTTLYSLLPIGKSFDLITRDLYIGDTKAFFLGINGLCKTEVLQQIFSDLQNPLYTKDAQINDLPLFLNSKLGYAQLSLCDNWDEILRNVLSGPSLLLVEGFS